MMFKKTLCTFILLFTLKALSAQGNLTDLDYKIFRLGFSLGTNYMHLDVEHTEFEQDGKIYYAQVSDVLPGFTVGLITDLRLHRHFNFRVTPSLLLGERHLYFKSYDVSTGMLEDDQRSICFLYPLISLFT